MNRALTVIVLLSAVFFGCAIGASAESGNQAWVKIPFAFHAGDRLMPAGNYLFEMPVMGGYASGTMLRISSPDGTLCQYLLSLRIGGVSADTDYHVTFSRYGDSYFLSKVRNSNLGAELCRSRTEKKLSQEFAKGSPSVSSYELVFVASKAK